MKPVPSAESGVLSSGMKTRRRGFIQSRLQNLGLSMMVMGLSFVFYYLGFFGGVEGPLSPGRIGDALARLGFSGRHLLMLCLSLTAIALTWNWLYNAFRRLLHKDMPGTGHGNPEARHRVIKKGTIGHFLWIMFLAFSIIVFCHLQ